MGFPRRNKEQISLLMVISHFIRRQKKKPRLIDLTEAR